MAIDIGFLNEAYFTFDKPVPYPLKCGKTLYINPVKLEDSMIFMTSYGILDIDKNLSTDVEIIQMSYLKFLKEKVLIDSATKQQLVNICLLCLGFELPYLDYDDKGRALLVNAVRDTDTNEYKLDLIITAKEFDDIKRIVLYQNLPNFDDEYVNPELKANMAEYDELKAKGINPPNLERRMAIISAHTGLTKAEQLAMTLRYHSLLFSEVSGEVEYMVTKPLAMYAGKSDNVQWIFKKSRGKYDDYITSVESYNKSMGGDGMIHTVTQGNNSGDLTSQFDKFIGG